MFMYFCFSECCRDVVYTVSVSLNKIKSLSFGKQVCKEHSHTHKTSYKYECGVAGKVWRCSRPLFLSWKQRSKKRRGGSGKFLPSSAPNLWVCAGLSTGGRTSTLMRRRRCVRRGNQLRQPGPLTQETAEEATGQAAEFQHHVCT